MTKKRKLPSNVFKLTDYKHLQPVPIWGILATKKAEDDKRRIEQERKEHNRQVIARYCNK